MSVENFQMAIMLVLLCILAFFSQTCADGSYRGNLMWLFSKRTYERDVLLTIFIVISACVAFITMSIDVTYADEMLRELIIIVICAFVITLFDVEIDDYMKFVGTLIIRILTAFAIIRYVALALLMLMIFI